jgi:hypothetical protein
MKCQECQAAATLHISDFSGRALVAEWHLCEDHGRRLYDTHPTPAQKADWRRSAEGIVAAHAVEGITDTTQGRPPPGSSGEVEVDVGRVVISEIYEQQVVFLREVGGGRIFPLMCGIFEATVLDRTLKGLPSPRPLTHDAWAVTIRAFGGEVQDVLVSDLREHIYLAEVRVLQGGRLVPSMYAPPTPSSWPVSAACRSGSRSRF